MNSNGFSFRYPIVFMSLTDLFYEKYNFIKDLAHGLPAAWSLAGFVG